MTDPKYIELQRFLNDSFLDENFLNDSKMFRESMRKTMNELVRQMFDGNVLFASLGNEPYDRVTKIYKHVGLAHYYLTIRKKIALNTEEFLMFEALELIDIFMGTTRSELLFATLENPAHINLAKVIKPQIQTPFQLFSAKKTRYYQRSKRFRPN